MKNIIKNFIKWGLIILFISNIITFIANYNQNKKIFFSDFIEKVLKNDIYKVNIQDDYVIAESIDGQIFTTLSPKFYPQMIDDLRSKNIKINIIYPSESFINSIFSILISWIPTIIFLFFYIKSTKGAGNQITGFGRTKAKLTSNSEEKIRFIDIAGIDEAKEELREVVHFLRNPKKFNIIGGKMPKGCLLVGAPGTGKTLLAKAVAGEAQVPFFTISGSNFVEMFVGVGASRVRDMFIQAKNHSPCIVFIDEIDAVGRNRSSGHGSNDEREQTLNQLLVEMDGFDKNQGVIIIGATNRSDVLDPALLRPGRFDRQVTVPMPDANGREQILRVHIKNIITDTSINLKVLAHGTPGLSGADLANLINEAALIAAKLNKESVSMKDLDYAKDKIIMGPERKSATMLIEEKKITAYHESGHALVSLYLTESDPIHKATIIPRGGALGMVVQLPENDRHHYSKSYLKTRLAIAMGGRVAEEIIFGKEKITTGASNDIKVATNIASNMVIKWGFSDKIGPVMFGKNKNNSGFTEDNETNITSNRTSNIIDEEVSRILESSYKVAKSIIVEHQDKLDLLSKILIKSETITGDNINNLVFL